MSRSRNLPEEPEEDRPPREPGNEPRPRRRRRSRTRRRSGEGEPGGSAGGRPGGEPGREPDNDHGRDDSAGDTRTGTGGSNRREERGQVEGRRRRRRDRPDDPAPSGPRRRRKPRDPDAAPPRTIRAEAIDHAALDRDALRVVTRLQRHGHEAYFVGGCVRDLMIGRRPKDFDVATDATPNEVRKLFRNGRVIGRRFRLVHVYYGDNIIETSTFRREPQLSDEGENEDLLIIEDNEYGTAGEDARRRDFTVNGLFFDPRKHQILDYVDGLDDLEDRVLRTIGDPMIRLAEDPVRILRAVKFATRLDFEIDEDTWDAMRANSDQLARSAPPRVLEEILRLMRSGSSLGAIKMLRACGALRIILPSVDQFLGPRRGGGEAVQRRGEEFWRLLEALDSEVHQGFEPTTPVCIAVLFAQLVEREMDPDARSLPGEPMDRLSVCDEVLDPLVSSSRLSRRDFGRARRILGCQERFHDGPSARFSPMLFTLAEEFPEALDLFGLRAEARGKGWDIYEAWKERRRRAETATEDELDDERRRIRKRRRRRRRPRKRRRK